MESNLLMENYMGEEREREVRKGGMETVERERL